MSRLIDADVLKQDINNVSTHWLNEWSTLGVLAMVDKQPTVDAVPVVRCWECRWHEDEQPGMVYCPATVGGWVSNDWYCKGGERKEEEDEEVGKELWY